MKERPILMSANMVDGLLKGTKWKTRRVVKIPAWFDDEYTVFGASEILAELECPYGKPGDHLWVREAFIPLTKGFAYRADGIWNEKSESMFKWRPGFHMPRSASRIRLEVVDVRVERLQEITDEDAIAEGVYRGSVMVGDGEISCYFGISTVADESAIDAFHTLWDSINNRKGYCAEDTKKGWDANPWVWVLELKRLFSS